MRYTSLALAVLASAVVGCARPPELVGIHIAGIVTLLSLGRVVVGGGLTEALGRSFVDRIQKYARLNAFPAKCQEVDVVPSKLEDNAGVYGAALIAAERLNGTRAG